MPKGPFLASEFTPTQWSTAEEKAQFGNTLLHFIESEWKETLFTKKLYNRLMNTFGHIAHYNQGGFYSEWFTTELDRLRFLDHLLRWPCYGDPAYTFCDVERALQREVRARNYRGKQQVVVAEAVRAFEMATLEKLEAKYRQPRSESLSSEQSARTGASIRQSPPVAIEPAQGTLF
jgi:hypothetical protein